MDPYSAALENIKGIPANFPTFYLENELNLLGNLINGENDYLRKRGTSVLLVGPSLQPLQSAVNGLLKPHDVCIYLHGNVHRDPSSIISLFGIHLSLDTSQIDTFSDLAIQLEDYLAHNNDKRLTVVLSAFEGFVNCQNFLYSLFELTAVCRLNVLCLSSSCDVLDALEKRVKSRFSQNTIYLYLPRDFTTYLECLRRMLLPSSAASHKKYKKYEGAVKGCLSDTRIVSFLEEQFEQSHDPLLGIGIFIDSLIEGNLTVQLVHQSIDNATSKAINTNKVPSNLSHAEWCILVALLRCQKKYKLDVTATGITFELIYREYSAGFSSSAAIADGHHLSTMHSRIILRMAFDRLCQLRLVETFKSQRNETVDSKEEIVCRFPLDLISEHSVEHCPSSSLLKLAQEVFG